MAETCPTCGQPVSPAGISSETNPAPLGAPFGGIVPVVVRSMVGYRRDPVTGAEGEYHNGTDYAVPVGTPVHAVEGGIVTDTWDNDPLNGTAIAIDHRRAGAPYRSSYVHLSRRDVNPGDVVTRGQVIGLSGGARGAWGSGKSTGPHLHLTLKRWNGAAWETVESLPLIDWRGVDIRDTAGNAVRVR